MFFSAGKKGDDKSSFAGLDVADVNQAVTAIVSTFPGSPQVTVVKDFASLPEAIKTEAVKQDMGESFPGVLYGKGAFVVADNLESIVHLEEVLLYEIMGHYGIKQLFGNREIEKLNELFNAMGGMPGLLKLARDNNWDTVTDYARGFAKAGHDSETRKALLVHELLAHQAQVKRPALVQKIKEYIGAVKAWLREHNFKYLSALSTNDLAYILKQARDLMTSPGDMSGIYFLRSGKKKDKRQYELFQDDVKQQARQNSVEQPARQTGPVRVIEDSSRGRAVAHIASVTAKQPWEMTAAMRKERDKAGFKERKYEELKAKYGDFDTSIENGEWWKIPLYDFLDTHVYTGVYGRRFSEDIARYEHRYTIEQALSEGKHVPANVLVDYPDLTGQPVRPNSVEQQTRPNEPAATRKEQHRSESVSARGLVNSDAFMDIYINHLDKSLRSGGFTPYFILDEYRKNHFDSYREIRIVLEKNGSVVGYVTRQFFANRMYTTLMRSQKLKNRLFFAS